MAIEGNLIAYYYDIGMPYTTGLAQWRAPIASQRAVIIAQMEWCHLLPESPRWHIQCRFSFQFIEIDTDRPADGKHEEAIDIIAQRHGNGVQVTEPMVIKQKRAIDSALALESAEGPWKFSERFKNGD